MKSKGSIRTTITAILVVAFTTNSMAQTVTGYVKDAASGTPLSNASVAIKGQHGGARTNSEGRFRIPADKFPVDIVVSNVGYDPTTIHLDSFPRLDMQIRLNRQFKELGKATVRNKRKKYRNKGNPAVELIRAVIDHKNSNRMEAYNYATYEKYEKLQVSVDKANNTKVAKNKLLKPYHFLVENGDTSKLEGRVLSPVYLEETLSDVYYRKDPEKTKT
ncbi:MAG TPA: carboxypeptidase-like regulatory domain-containing protein, partial [Puia sp.]|nr:carboxypeptidase-like regulatory domain-containing protein [Puia sp.]